MALGDDPRGLLLCPSTDSTCVLWGGFVTTSQGRTQVLMDARKYKRTTTQRLTVVLSGVVFQRVEEQSQKEGRSMSNLVAYLVERALCDDCRTGR
jgi:hypothetical protein